MFETSSHWLAHDMLERAGARHSGKPSYTLVGRFEADGEYYRFFTGEKSYLVRAMDAIVVLEDYYWDTMGARVLLVENRALVRSGWYD